MFCYKVLLSDVCPHIRGWHFPFHKEQIRRLSIDLFCDRNKELHLVLYMQLTTPLAQALYH